MSWQAMLEALAAHSLPDQAALALMDRVDTKFVVPERLLCRCFDGLSGDYTLLEMEGRRQMAYDTLYFDTPGRQYYLDHHNGKLNRLKVRTRHYRNSGDSFLEVKHKNNRGRTVKERRALASSCPSLSELQGLMAELLDQSADRLSPTLSVRYHRRTLINPAHQERVTLDTDLSFQSAQSGHRAVLPGLAVLELKSASLATESPLARRLKALGCRPVAFSKYCIGTALLEPEQVKTNRFKPILSSLVGVARYFKESSWNPPSIPISSFG